ncbi:hypothetical protein [Alcanivorax sp. 1008]|uniref:hypothetical protein n=1 Tax=Alcanivorax sp. 1008 TaxID=2816853 RepID=UPI001DFF60A2|nr:hypothetical protein [Alcanivorax sp. 1008]MCC1498093.1 site-specific integrase [Alcanivorax sp. 1008]
MEMVAGLKKPISPFSKPDTRLINQGVLVSPLQEKIVLKTGEVVYLWPKSIRRLKKVKYLPAVNVIIDFRKTFSEDVIISYICWRSVESIAPRYCIPVFKKLLYEIEEISKHIPKPRNHKDNYQDELHEFVRSYTINACGNKLLALKIFIDCAGLTPFKDLFVDAKKHMIKRKVKKRVSHHTGVSWGKGPFTKRETAQIIVGLNDDRLNSRDKFIIAFLLEIGCRGLSLAQMRHQDIVMHERGKIRSIRIPPVKLRTLKSDMPANIRKGISARLGECYANYLDDVSIISYRDGAGYLIGELRSESDEMAMKMFAPVEWGLEKINRSLRNSAKTLGLKADNGSPLRLSVYRFRHTLGLRMACIGSSAVEIAAALGHAGTEAVEKYIRQGSAMAQYIDSAMSSSETHLEASSSWKNPMLARKSMKKIMSIGHCSKASPCNLHPGYSCYTCARFQPSENIDHQESIEQITNYFDFFTGRSSSQIAASAIYLKDELIMRARMFSVKESE